MTLTSKVVPYKRGFGPFAPGVYRSTAPYEYRGVGTEEAIMDLLALFKSDVDPESVACVVLGLQAAPEPTTCSPTITG